MQIQAVGPFEWNGEMVEAGAVVDIPDDDPYLDLLRKAGKFTGVTGEPPPGPPPEGGAQPEGERQGGTPPMSSGSVGRRQVPRAHEASPQ